MRGTALGEPGSLSLCRTCFIRHYDCYPVWVVLSLLFLAGLHPITPQWQGFVCMQAELNREILTLATQTLPNSE
jgi:hypothetical protein